MLEAISTISPDALSSVTGGNASWAQVRSSAQPHCPNTVAAHPRAPTSRAQAQRIGNACLAEMGSFKASMGGRARIQAGIDEAFPR